ncbi:MAG: GntR family transcriptional regulator [Bryobacterales bacterium]|nr:GntR family transcriptional regulator [Bryobacterales bacterium]
MARTILRDGVYERLLAEILEGRIAPGSSLREERLAADLDVSRTPIREALRKLAEEGFVEYLPHRGAKLLMPTPTLAREIFQIREALEAVAVREAAVNMSPARLLLLRDHMESLRPRVAAGDLSDVGDLLHDEIFAACQNRRLEQMMQVFGGQVKWLQNLACQMPDRLPHAFREHDSVITALESRDPEWAESALRAHIRNTLHDLLVGLEEPQQQTNSATAS